MKFYNIKKIVISILIFILITKICPIKAKCLELNNILILASYDLENEWESDIIEGIKEVLDDGENRIYIEFLDFDKARDNEYYEKFYQFLNSKYNNKDIKAIYSIDDEALNFIRDNMFRKDSFCYKKQIFFVGVNDLNIMTEEEKKYISGVLDVENSLETVDVIIKTIKSLDTIYLVLSPTKYCQSLKDSISNMYLANEDIRVEIIEATLIDDLLEQLKGIKSDNAAMILSGTYSDNITHKTVDSKRIISEIKSTTNIPIFSTLENYIQEGAIGGIVNDAENLGKIGAVLLERISLEQNETYFLTPPNNSVYSALFNFKEIRKYKINPLDCPANSIFINKPRYDFILPIGIVITIWSSIIIFALFVIIIIILNIVNKKKADKLYLKYVEVKTREKIKTDSLILMSHEFRTPLNVIMSTTDLLLIKCKNNNMENEYFEDKLNSIIKNSRRLKRAVDNSIDVTKLDIGVMDINFKMYNIVEVVEDITDSTIDYAKKSNIDIIFDTNEEEIYTAIDKRSIERIILNLLSNSIKSIDNSGEIYVTCERKDDNVFIYVKDNGCGIDSESMKHIFEKYYQSNNSNLSRSDEGSGLGLYIVQGLVHLHKGNISVQSEVGKGTIFTIEIPIIYVDLPNDNEKKNENLSETEMSNL